MGTSRNAAELVGKLDKAAKLLDRDMYPTVQSIGMVLAATALAGAAEATGGDLKFSGAQRKGRTGRAIGVTTRKESDSSVMVKATGPMHWLEAGVDPHPIIPGASKKSRVSPAPSSTVPKARRCPPRRSVAPPAGRRRGS